MRSNYFSFFLIVLSLVIITGNPLNTQAAVISPATAISTAATAAATTAPSDAMTNLQQRATAEITRRTTSLTSLNTAVNGYKKLSDAQKTTLTGNITSEISNLNALKTKINADTDKTVLKADVQSIITSYRVFAVYEPQIRLIGASDSISASVEALTALATKLQGYVDQGKTAGTDVAILQASLTEMKSKITDAQTQASSVQNVALSLAPSGYPGDKTSMQTARSTLKTAITNLKTARQDAGTVVAGLKKITVNLP